MIDGELRLRTLGWDLHQVQLIQSWASDHGCAYNRHGSVSGFAENKNGVWSTFRGCGICDEGTWTVRAKYR